MLTMYILWTLSMMFGSAISSWPVFSEFLQVKRMIAFRRAFPDHVIVQMVDEKIVTDLYAEKKSKALRRLQTVGLLAVWPLTVPFMVGMLFAEGVKFTHKKVTGINSNMAPTITIDHYKIREEEGR